jgi:hypothetical protein
VPGRLLQADGLVFGSTVDASAAALSPAVMATGFA